MPQAPCTSRHAGDSAPHPAPPAHPPRPASATPAGHGTSTAREPTCPLSQRLARHAWDDPQDARPVSARLRHTTGWSAAHIQRVLVDVPAEYKQQVLGAMAGAKMRNLPVSIRVAKPGLEDGERAPSAEEDAPRRSSRPPAAKRTAQHTRPPKSGAPRTGKTSRSQAPQRSAKSKRQRY